MMNPALNRAIGLGMAIGWIVLGTTPAALARPGSGAGTRPMIRALDPGGGTDLPRGDGAGVFGAAQSGTTWFGGTVWAADSMRWEAIEGQLWTFESGVGSSIVPPGGPGDLSTPTRDWVNPFKPAELHATMEGWIGFDNTYSEIEYFRRISSQDPRWSEAVCVGASGGLTGTYSFWCGVFPGEADAQCYGSGQGYGNSWNVCIEHPFTYTGGQVALRFAYRNDTEQNFDYTTVQVDSSGSGTYIEATSFTGVSSGVANVALVPGIHLPEIVPASIKVKFCFNADGAWSDQDGLYSTSCGAFAVDDIWITGGGINHTASFEVSDDGWTLSPPKPGEGGEWANLYHVSDLPPMNVACPCAVYDSVLAFPDDANGHPWYADNLAASPWIDLKAAGLVGAPGKIIRTNLAADVPLLNYIFTQFAAQWYPEECLRTGKLITSPWTPNGFMLYFPFPLQCTRIGSRGSMIDYSAVVPTSAEQVRIAVGVLSYCRFFTNCSQVSNTSPWYDEVGLGVYGVSDAPIILVDTIDSPQDNFPENGTSFLYATGRVDCNNIQGDSQPEVGTTLGDTLIIQGAQGGAEVYVHFRVRRGPRTDSRRFNQWYYSHPVSPMDPGFRVARCDTAERGNSGPISGNWMTAYHEVDPNFQGSDRDVDPSDQAPNGGLWRLRNDIFPDDLFTAGTRIDCFFSANFVGNPASYRTPLAPATFEIEILPSSYNGNDQWNCVLYVDHFNRGAQAYIESALSQILGTGSPNFEGTNWDRFDVNAESSQQMSFGRPLQTEYGATLLQALAYKVILWNSGNLNAFNLTKEDADVLIPWLTLIEFGDNCLYLSGDGVVYGALFEDYSEPSAARLIRDIAGVGLVTGCADGSFRIANCPAPGSPADLTQCVRLDPVGGAPVAGTGGGRSVDHYGQGNGCPGPPGNFDVFSVGTPDWGVAVGDERYVGALKSAEFASVVTDASPSGVLNYKIVTDGISVHYRRDVGPDCYYPDSASAVTGRLREVLTYFGMGLDPDFCTDRTAGTGLTELKPPKPVFVTRLVGISPNPLVTGALGRIRFTLAREGRAVLEVYDLQGRLVNTVFDGVAQAGENEGIWTGTDEAGTAVGSGVYFYRFLAEGLDTSGRVVVISTGRK